MLSCVLLLAVSLALLLFYFRRRTASQATEELIRLCKQKGDKYWHLPAAEVEKVVQAGADVTVRTPYLTQPVLCQFIHLGLVDCVKACLASPRELDFTVCDFNGNSPLHCICTSTVPPSVAKEMLSLVVYRIETHPTDLVDLNIRNGRGDCFVDLMARNQLLSALWPHVRHLPCFADRVSPIGIQNEAWQWDWEKLAEDMQACLHPKILIQCDEPTATLFKLSNDDFPDTAEVRRCVQNGADVLFRPPGTYWSSFHRFLSGGNVECVAECLKTHRSMDFTSVDPYQAATPLHAICCNSMDNKASEEAILKLVLHRLEECAGRDTIDWTKKNGVGMDFISHVAACERLSLFWPILREQVEYFKQYEGPLPINAVIFRSDWNQLAKDDQLRFKPLKGFE